MTDQEYRTQEFRNLGFRCLEATSATLLDGRHVTIKANVYERSAERPDDTPRRKRALRNYMLTDSDGVNELIDELSLEERMGTVAFNALPA